MVLILSDLYQEYFNTTYGNLTQYTAVITARSMALSRRQNQLQQRGEQRRLLRNRGRGERRGRDNFKAEI